MVRRDGSMLSTALAIGVFIAVVATWLFISPSIIRSAWQTERSGVHAWDGPGEHLIFRQAMAGLQQSMAKDFREFLLEADAIGGGSFGQFQFQPVDPVTYRGNFTVAGAGRATGCMS